MTYTPFLFISLIINSWMTENKGSRWLQSPAIIQPKYSFPLLSSSSLFSLFSLSLSACSVHQTFSKAHCQLQQAQNLWQMLDGDVPAHTYVPTRKHNEVHCKSHLGLEHKIFSQRIWNNVTITETYLCFVVEVYSSWICRRSS